MIIYDDIDKNKFLNRIKNMLSIKDKIILICSYLQMRIFKDNIIQIEKIMISKEEK